MTTCLFRESKETHTTRVMAFMVELGFTFCILEDEIDIVACHEDQRNNPIRPHLTQNGYGCVVVVLCLWP